MSSDDPAFVACPAQDYDGVLEEIARIDGSVMREEITQLRDEAVEKRDPMVQAGNFDPYYKWLGIPPEEQPPNHYRLLGVRLYETDFEVIESAADRQMAYIQQCAMGPYSEESQQLLNELAAARVCLLNSDSKSEYDISLRKLLAKVRKRAQKKQQEREAEELEPVLPEPTGQRRRPGSRKRGQRRRSNWKQFPWMVIGVAAVAVGFASWGTYRLLNSDGSAVTVAKDDTTTLVPEVAAGTGTSSKEAKGEKAAPSPTKKDMGATEPSAKPGRSPLAIAPFQATPAVVAVERMVPVAFTIKSDPTLIPEHLRGASTWVFAAKVATGEKNAVLRFNVLQSGKVYLIAHWQYEGNTRGNWHKERLTKKQLIAQGWQDLGPCAWDQESFLFKKTVKQGEVFSIRTNKYWPPKLVTRSVSPALAIAPFDATTAKQHQQDWADHLGTPAEITNSIGMKLKLVPAGAFMMGEGGEAHKVTLTKPFFVGVYEVTQEQYQRVTLRNPSKHKGANNPVGEMTWITAVSFCAMLSQLPEEKAAGRIYRLPTEAEWEYACRAGTTTAYSFGDNVSLLGEYAWFANNADNRTHPVGQKKPNAWGLYDMHGNATEWCQDWKADYPSGAVTDPVGPSSGTARINRSGHPTSNWSISTCRSAWRGGTSPGLQNGDLGFRVVYTIAKSVDPATKAKPSNEPVPQSSTLPPIAVAPFDSVAAKAHQAAWAEHLGIPIEVTNSIGMELMLIPPGEFMMGSPEDEPGHRPNETLHKVTLTQPFQMGMHEVTQDQYERVMGVNPSRWKGGSRPVENIGNFYHDATEFCVKLSEISAEKVNERVYRLPTEAEWEYACRAGTISAYSFGDSDENLGDYAWCEANAGGRRAGTHPVGEKKPNQWGLYDMLGNLGELCHDRYADYLSVAVSDPAGPASGSLVYRGGSCEINYNRSAERFEFYPGIQLDNRHFGFRVICTIANSVDPATKAKPSNEPVPQSSGTKSVTEP